MRRFSTMSSPLLGNWVFAQPQRGDDRRRAALSRSVQRAKRTGSRTGLGRIYFPLQHGDDVADLLVTIDAAVLLARPVKQRWPMYQFALR